MSSSVNPKCVQTSDMTSFCGIRSCWVVSMLLTSFGRDMGWSQVTTNMALACFWGRWKHTCGVGKVIMADKTEVSDMDKIMSVIGSIGFFSVFFAFLINFWLIAQLYSQVLIWYLIDSTCWDQKLKTRINGNIKKNQKNKKLVGIGREHLTNPSWVQPTCSV